MAKKLSSEEQTNTVIYNNNGEETIQLGFSKREFEDDDGTEFYETVAENIECGDGTVIGPGHLMRPPNQGGVTLQRCHECQRESQQLLFNRNRNTNQFSPSANIKRCFHCGKNLCSKHVKIFENHVVCNSCRKKQFVLQRIVKPMFFKHVEES